MKTRLPRFTQPHGRQANITVPRQRQSPPWKVRIFREIRQVDACEWDALLDPDEIQMSHRFIQACQEARLENAEFWHLMLYQGGTLCAVASLSRFRVSLDVLATGLARAAVCGVRRFSQGFLRIPILFCGLPVSFGQPAIKFRRGADVSAILGVIAAIMERIAMQTGVRLLCFKEFDPVQTVEMDGLRGYGYFRTASLPSCSLCLRWGCFDSYLQSMRAGYRRQINETLRIRAQAGLSVRAIHDFSAECGILFGLYEQVIERASHRLERLNRGFIDGLNRLLDGRSRAILIEREGRPLAAAIMLFGPSEATYLLAGLDYQHNRMYQAYQNLVIEVVAEAIRSGVTRLEMGQTSYAVKGRMGALEVPRYLYWRCRSAIGHALLRRASPWLFPETICLRRHVFAR